MNSKNSSQTYTQETWLATKLCRKIADFRAPFRILKTIQRSRLYTLKRSLFFDTLKADTEYFKKTNAVVSQTEPINICDNVTDTI